MQIDFSTTRAVINSKLGKFTIHRLDNLESQGITQLSRLPFSIRVMLESVQSDLAHVMHVNVFLKNMSDFEEMNRAYVEMMGAHRPARTVIGVAELPKPGVLLTMNLTAVTKE